MEKRKRGRPPKVIAVSEPTLEEKEHFGIEPPAGDGDIFVRVAPIDGDDFLAAYQPEMVRIKDGVVIERKLVGEKNVVNYAFARAMELVDPRI